MNNDYVFIKTVYNIDEYRNILLLLNDNKIKYKLNDKTKFINYKDPKSTFIEVDLYIHRFNYNQFKNLKK